MQKLMTTEEAAALLSLEPNTLRRMCRAGTIPHVKVGRQYRFELAVLESWIEAQRVQARSPEHRPSYDVTNPRSRRPRKLRAL